MNETEDLGWANGWGETPEVVKKCREAGHSPVEIGLGSCVHQVTCDKCKITYRYDSGDCGS